jgi:hypothetical protein
MINYEKFYSEIKAAGLPIETMSLPEGSLPGAIQFPDVWISFNPTLTAGQITTLNALYNAHNPTDNAAARSAAAEAAFAALPNWATWDYSDWNTWYAANISSTQITAVASLADAKAVMGKMSIVLDNLAKSVISLRNRTFPKIPGL